MEISTKIYKFINFIFVVRSQLVNDIEQQIDNANIMNSMKLVLPHSGLRVGVRWTLGLQSIYFEF